jgi:hypothetical protein
MSDGNKSKPQPPRPGSIQLNISEAEAQGIYANIAVISHSGAEIILDFARILPGVPKAKVHARIVMTPYHAKALHRALGDNLNKFEKKFGAIRTGDGTDDSSPIGF